MPGESVEEALQLAVLLGLETASSSMGALEPVLEDPLFQGSRADVLLGLMRSAEGVANRADAMVMRLATMMAADPQFHFQDEHGYVNSAAEEIGLALGKPAPTVGRWLKAGKQVFGRLYATGEVLEAGKITAEKACVIAEALDKVDLDLAVAVQDAVLPDAPDRTAHEIKGEIARLLVELEPDRADERHRQARSGRYVSRLTRKADGMATFRVHLPADCAVTVATALNKAAEFALSQGDARTKAQLRADALATWGLDALTLGGTLAEFAVPEVSVLEELPGLERVGGAGAGSGTGAGSARAGSGAGAGGAPVGDVLFELTGDSAGAGTTAAGGGAQACGEMDASAGAQCDGETDARDASETEAGGASETEAQREARREWKALARWKPRTISRMAIPPAKINITVPLEVVARVLPDWEPTPSVLPRVLSEVMGEDMDVATGEDVDVATGELAGGPVAGGQAPGGLAQGGLLERTGRTEAAWLEGYGPLAPAVATLLSGGGTWRRIITDSRTGLPLDVGRAVYKPPTGITEAVRVRDRTCCRPGCTNPGEFLELDHVRAWAEGGSTSDLNNAFLCKRCHRIKSVGAGHLSDLRENGRRTWTSTLGNTYVKPPERPPRKVIGVSGAESGDSGDGDDPSSAAPAF
ncbi:MAG TPA: DUF222 domain-containing protein [Actinomycetales bacterium]|nr:DUF222 domain-containing protein [Actinomycetales bacterium]